MTKPYWDCGVQHDRDLGIPKGDVSNSPGLRGTRYPGYTHSNKVDPEGVASFKGSGVTLDATRFGVGGFFQISPG